jgi:thiol-disulfide isomerase/thioredoxin
MATAIYKTFDAPKYAIYWLEEPKSKKVDTNSGEYFKVPFCDLRGRLLEASVKLQAQSYTGVLEAHEIERSVNYARAIAVWCGPCRVERKELENFQQDHPELVVLTAVDTTADSKDLRDLIREKALESLRIAPTPPGLMEKFGASGYPNTFVIDKKGFVRLNSSEEARVFHVI